MPNQSKDKTCITGQWNNADKKKLVCVVEPIIDMQNSYGKTLNMITILRGWETMLSNKYTVDQLIYAIGEYVLKRDDFPTISGLNKILDPEKPKITNSQYVAAQKYQERNGYPKFSQQRDTILEYEAQENSAREVVSPYLLENETVKMIEG